MQSCRSRLEKLTISAAFLPSISCGIRLLVHGWSLWSLCVPVPVSVCARLTVGCVLAADPKQLERLVNEDA